MAYITYNDLSSPENLITFSDVPNILKVEDSAGGTYATFSFVINTSFKDVTTADGQWYITFLGETITNVLDPANAVNKNFYVSNSNTSTIASMVRAFRNCPGIIANFDVEMAEYGSVSGVRLRARAVGSIWTGISGYLDTNIPSTYMTANGTDGSASSSLNGAKIDVDVYIEDAGGTKYVTTLEKNWYGGEAAFNMSPVLTTVSKVGRTVPYTFRVSSLKDGEYALIGSVGMNYASVGYMCNQGDKYIPLSDGIYVAQNVSRGTSRSLTNNMLLYMYGSSIPLSFYAENVGGMTITVTYRDSAYNVITSTTMSWHNTDSEQKLKDIEIQVGTTSAYSYSYYVDVSLGGADDVLRYNVIKPLKATEYWQRILWRNSYGGVSFFDFTGQRSESRDVEVTTYQKNIFDYYTSDMNELEKPYDNDVKYTVTLKSHLFENDGKYIFNDLAQSSTVWTVVNGEKYEIIIESVSVDETDRNNVYEATVKYRYSMKPSLI